MATPEHPAAPPAPSAAPSQDAPDVLGRRIAAALLDLVPLIALFVLVAALLGDTSSGDGGASASVEGGPALLLFALALVYYGAFEAAWAATPGKRLLGLKVVDEQGAKPAGGAIAIRTIARVIDGLCFYAVAFIAVLATGPRRQRLGDLAAKTRVVRA